MAVSLHPDKRLASSILPGSASRARVLPNQSRFTLYQFPNAIVCQSGISKLHSESVKPFACSSIKGWLNANVHFTTTQNLACQTGIRTQESPQAKLNTSPLSPHCIKKSVPNRRLKCPSFSTTELNGVDPV